MQQKQVTTQSEYYAITSAKNKRITYKVIVGHFRKIAILAINFIFNRRYVFRFIGFVNRYLKLIGSVFVAYPASEEYALAYVYPRHRHMMRWTPWPVGIFLQNGKWGIMFVISSTEKDFMKPEHEDNLRKLVEKTEHIRMLVRAPQKTFAGILPSVLFAKGIIRETIETDVTVEAIIKAESEVRETQKYDSNVPLIVLGGMGFVGRRLVRKLDDREVHCIDFVSKSGGGGSMAASYHWQEGYTDKRDEKSGFKRLYENVLAGTNPY